MGVARLFVAIVVSGTRPRIQEFSGVYLSCSVVQSQCLFESFSTGRAALGLPGGLVEVSPFASGLCGVACLLFRKRSSVQI